MPSIKSRENNIRRQLAKLEPHGIFFSLHKTPARDPARRFFAPGYMIKEFDEIKFGACFRKYDASLDDIEIYTDHVFDLVKQRSPYLFRKNNKSGIRYKNLSVRTNQIRSTKPNNK